MCQQWLQKRKRQGAFVKGGIVEAPQGEGASLLLLDTVAQIDPLVVADIVGN